MIRKFIEKVRRALKKPLMLGGTLESVGHPRNLPPLLAVGGKRLDEIRRPGLIVQHWYAEAVSCSSQSPPELSQDQ